ncbi:MULTISPECIES: TetR/AcrR family transcriptional regulator [unclassified Clostridioides]|uniref:TetR/AcrR family transcriptional regulator n=1 Tax=unclassified Clostridioides TaxID=2635829 RepID=UPI001D10EB1F|nr:TetR/AcrR family transcriptional regulator [Clostridioides sp. ES-S-0001-02]MCC0640233.1 TetR/AcrR family transcriptional regulator [Clostridioides sp. ES-S-0049-03]MCC0657791.1 TetR/AcrR family transcriptional regulator [Clostridioides sp. ES-S-0123-01]MCC0674544.1 TetR/AcrR family transcriptional regulator [Clostridioides sp. ES-W-0018-02]MCC0703554.1 TetR/AcrR family transcriptional regulator [Clostridioides sp. ES-S-0049-02]MCC0710640.1 TetR/AcrR family transcriptional regulator [Clostr
MPTKLFFELNEDKQRNIISVGISEFATYGYTNSSTNRIVKSSGISKGSLFKYFSTKEELYFFILDTVTADFIESLEKKTIAISPELFQRIIEYSALEFSWYIQNPEKAKLLIGAFTRSDTEIYQKTIERYSIKEFDVYDNLVKDIDLSNFRWDKQKTIDILKWFLKGFNDSFLVSTQIDNYSFEHIQNEYVKSLTEYLEILKMGLLK